jgi:anionic cell wall polymer biosynthesis LytR-Cps2A-Psr (LCP) family protein
MMVVAINPKQKKSTIVSLDRDILTKIVLHTTKRVGVIQFVIRLIPNNFSQNISV